MPEFPSPKTILLVSGRADSSPFKTHMMPTEHLSQSMCFRRAQTTSFWRRSRVSGCGACREPGLYVLPPLLPGVLVFLPSLFLVGAAGLHLSSTWIFLFLWGEESLRASKKTWNQLCQTFPNLHAWKSFFHPPEHWSISQPLKMRPLSTREAFLTNLGSHDNYLPLCFHHSLNLVGLII